MNIVTLTEEQVEKVVLTVLERDLANQLSDQDTWKDLVGVRSLGERKTNKKLIKMLKRAINFYSITPPYPEVL